MNLKQIVLNNVFIFAVYLVYQANGAMMRCFNCRSRSDLGSCKDPFKANATLITPESGIEVIPCASGWCAKVLENDNPSKEEYGVATQRMCLQRAPPDGESRCGLTKFSHRTVYMCLCRGDLCNSSDRSIVNLSLLTAVSLLSICKLIF